MSAYELAAVSGVYTTTGFRPRMEIYYGGTGHSGITVEQHSEDFILRWWRGTNVPYSVD